MTDPEKAFYALFGEAATEAQRRRILDVEKALGLRRSDALWSLFVVLGYFQQLYETIPDRIKHERKAAITNIRKAADTEIEAARARAAQTITKSFGELAQKLVEEATDTAKWEARAKAFLALTLCVIVLVMGTRCVGGQRYAEGFEAAADVDPDTTEWASSAQGRHARELSDAGLLEGLDEARLRWLNSPQGEAIYKLAQVTRLAELGKEDIDWLLSRTGMHARVLARNNYIDYSTNEKLRWLNSADGEVVYNKVASGVIPSWFRFLDQCFAQNRIPICGDPPETE